MKYRVEHINRRYKSKIYSYPFLVSSYRDEKGKPQRKIHQKLSHLPPEAVKALENTFNNKDKHEYVNINEIIFKEAFDFGDTWAAFRICEILGITKQLQILPDSHRVAILAMIIDRVINPKPFSKQVLSNDYPQSGLNSILCTNNVPTFHSWYKSLETLHENQMEIQKNLFTESIDRIFLYDITSSYFEGKNCPLAVFGYNRDGKKGKVQIVVGLLCNSDGRPVAVRVFEGNTKDDTTVLAQVVELKKEFGVKEMVFVGDRGMITSKRIEEFNGEDYDWLKYITALKRSDMMALVEDENHPVQLGLFDEINVSEVVEGNKRYVLCHNPMRKDEDAKTRNKLLKKTEDKLQSLRDNVKKGRLKSKDKIAKRLYRWINHWNMERFFIVNYNEGKFEYSRKEEEIKRYAVLDGCYVITTDISVEKMDKKEVLTRYKSLAHVEKAFRSMKTTELDMRPIRHWTPERGRGHVFVCMLAYLVIWEVRNRLKEFLDPKDKKNKEMCSLRLIWETLRKIKIGRINCGEKEIKAISILNQYQKKNS